MALATAVLAGERRALARALTLVERGGDAAGELLAALWPRIGNAQRVGLTGAPGVGKSSLASALVAEARARGRSVALVAVDPTSPVSGGALLGDRIRLGAHAGDSQVFVRSLASRDAPGGLSAAAGDSLDVLDAAGFDLLLLETVGAGQGDVDVARETATTVVVVAPGAGDAIQAMKSGILEIGDLWVVNKADLPGAQEARESLIAGLTLRAEGEDAAARVLLVSAERGEGVRELLDALDRRHATLRAGAAPGELRRRQVAGRIGLLAAQGLRAEGRLAAAAADGLAAAVVSGRMTAREAAAELLRGAAARLSAKGSRS